MSLKLTAIAGVLAVFAFLYFRASNSKAPSSVIVLALKYLSRPHSTLVDEYVFNQIMAPSAWNGSYLSKHPEIWIDILTESDKQTLTSAVMHFQGLNKTIELLSIEDFPLSADLLKKIDAWKYQLEANGRGFQVIRGVPVDRWSMEQSEIFYFAFGKYLGIPGAQDNVGSLLGHVTDIGPSNHIERPYRQKVDIAYHCDGSDVVGLLCIHSAKSGGASRIISSVTVYNQLLKHHPKGQEYIRRLFGHVLLFTRKTFGLATHFPVHPLRQDSRGVLRTYWNQEYYTKSYRNADGTLTPMGEADPAALEAVEAYDAILTKDIQRKKKSSRVVTPVSAAIATAADECRHSGNHVDVEDEDEAVTCNSEDKKVDENDDDKEDDHEEDVELGLEMYLQQGDIQLVSNHFVMHARTEFEDYSAEEISAATTTAAATAATQAGQSIANTASDGKPLITPIGKRDLLRLWVSHTNEEMPWDLFISKQIDFLRVLGGLVEGLIKYR